MSERIQGIPEGAQLWKPGVKARRQTMADINEGAKLQEEVRVAIEQYWQKQMILRLLRMMAEKGK